MSRLSYYRTMLGFDQSEHVPFTKQYRIKCSQCAALVINGTPCHEHGCSHQAGECRECGSLVPAGGACCEVEGW